MAGIMAEVQEENRGVHLTAQLSKVMEGLSKLAQPGFRSGPGGRGCCAKERVLFGEGSLAYAAGVLRNTPRVITTGWWR